MGYEVLARKYRPQNFNEVIGQESTLQALVHALDNKRLHHAYLFTGIRGVGKTTLGRLLAKCFNCEERGITSTPCGTCNTCVSISLGKFIDLIEIDAASRTKVEDTRELLETTQYIPSQGRFKIYLIDEVHMLSMSSFNALLKTLEEPPEYVKFIFATTEIHKVPVTVLSRTLQFVLRKVSPTVIAKHLAFLLNKEQIEFEQDALQIIADASSGSVRDSLSIADQAIIFGEGKIKLDTTRSMLGLTESSLIFALCEAIFTQDLIKILEQINKIDEVTSDWHAPLALLLQIMHKLSIASFVKSDDAWIAKYASCIDNVILQAYYQILLTGMQDLGIAPNVKESVEMLMLRMVAFMPLNLDIPENMPYAEAKYSETVAADKKKQNITPDLDLNNNPIDNEQIIKNTDITQHALHHHIPSSSVELLNPISSTPTSTNTHIGDNMVFTSILQKHTQDIAFSWYEIVKLLKLKDTGLLEQLAISLSPVVFKKEEFVFAISKEKSLLIAQLDKLQEHFQRILQININLVIDQQAKILNKTPITIEQELQEQKMQQTREDISSSEDFSHIQNTLGVKNFEIKFKA